MSRKDYAADQQAGKIKFSNAAGASIFVIGLVGRLRGATAGRTACVQAGQVEPFSGMEPLLCRSLFGRNSMMNAASSSSKQT